MAEPDTQHESKETIEVTPEAVEKEEEFIDKLKKKDETIAATEGAIKELEEKEEKEKLKEEKGKIKEIKEEQKDFRKMSPQERRRRREEEAKVQALESWIPKTELGKAVKAGKEKDLDVILEKGKRILESEIVDTLIPNLQTDLILIGQAKGKFGGGKRRAWRQTQKKTKEGNVLTFSSMAIVGIKGYIGVGYGTAKETLPAREKALRKAKLNIIKIRRGFETSEPGSNDPHTVPYTVEGKEGSVKIRLIPAPRGTGLAVADECKKILKLAGIKDVYGKTFGHTRTTFWQKHASKHYQKQPP